MVGVVVNGLGIVWWWLQALTYGQMDDEEKELLAAEEAGDSDEDVDETNSGDDDNEDDEEANGAAAKDDASSDSDTGASPARKKRRGGKKDKKSPFLTYGDLPHGASVVDVPASVRNSPRFAVCYAHEEEGWVEVVLKFPASYQKLLMLDAAERAADKTLVRATKGVSRALVMQQRINGQKRLCVQTEGVNLSAAASLAEWVDINAVDTNDIGAVLRYVVACHALAWVCVARACVSLTASSMRCGAGTSVWKPLGRRS